MLHSFRCCPCVSFISFLAIHFVPTSEWLGLSCCHGLDSDGTLNVGTTTKTTTTTATTAKITQPTLPPPTNRVHYRHHCVNHQTPHRKVSTSSTKDCGEHIAPGLPMRSTHPTYPKRCVNSTSHKAQAPLQLTHPTPQRFINSTVLTLTVTLRRQITHTSYRSRPR